ncbi:MAG: phosphate uptake regulator PhoU [Nanoarchaeota archaeon]
MVEIDPRKVIKFGTSSFVISLPNNWIKDHNLGKGDLVYLTKNGNGELTLSADKKERKIEEKPISLDIANLDVLDIKRKTIHAYVNGYNRIIFSGELNKRQHKEIKNIVSYLIGLEIIKQSSKEIVAKDIINFKDFSIEDVLRRMDNLVRAVFEEIISSIDKGINNETIKEIKNMDKDINRLYFLMWKLLRTDVNDQTFSDYLKITNLDLIDSWWVALSLEHIGDGLKRITEIMHNENLTKEEVTQFKNYFSRMYEIYAETIKAYHTKDVEKAYEMQRRRRELLSQLSQKTLKTSNSSIAKSYQELKILLGANHSIARLIVLNA